MSINKESINNKVANMKDTELCNRRARISCQSQSMTRLIMSVPSSEHASKQSSGRLLIPNFILMNTEIGINIIKNRTDKSLR